jgi:hypothetical protein
METTPLFRVLIVGSQADGAWDHFAVQDKSGRSNGTENPKKKLRSTIVNYSSTFGNNHRNMSVVIE